MLLLDEHANTTGETIVERILLVELTLLIVLSLLSFALNCWFSVYMGKATLFNRNLRVLLVSLVVQNYFDPRLQSNANIFLFVLISQKNGYKTFVLQVFLHFVNGLAAIMQASLC